MTAIQWTDELSVKIPSIDSQHKRLIKLINQLDESIKSGNANMVINVTINELVRYTEAHFVYEEALFSIHGYPESETHKKAHQKLFRKVEYFEKKIKENDPGIYSELLEFLNGWLYHHILEEDMGYSDHLVKTGAE